MLRGGRPQEGRDVAHGDVGNVCITRTTSRLSRRLHPVLRRRITSCPPRQMRRNNAAAPSLHTPRSLPALRPGGITVSLANELRLNPAEETDRIAAALRQ